MHDYELRASHLVCEVRRLVTARVWSVGEVLRERPSEAEVAGVYLISMPSAPDSMVYAGRTKTKTVRGRLRDHRSMATGSDLRGMLARWPDHPQVPEEYGVRWIEVPSAAERGAVEAFTIAVLVPTFNRW